jgi:hypothetical protein
VLLNGNCDSVKQLKEIAIVLQSVISCILSNCGAIYIALCVAEF